METRSGNDEKVESIGNNVADERYTVVLDYLDEYVYTPTCTSGINPGDASAPIQRTITDHTQPPYNKRPGRALSPEPSTEDARE